MYKAVACGHGYWLLPFCHGYCLWLWLLPIACGYCLCLSTIGYCSWQWLLLVAMGIGYNLCIFTKWVIMEKVIGYGYWLLLVVIS
jgi:hypothetical protein